MNNLILFINAFLSYLLIFLFVVILVIIACFIGIRWRKNKDAKAAGNSENKIDGEGVQS